MATGPMQGVIRHLRRATLPRDGAGPTDGELLERFVAAREEEAFEGLVRRHGPMVLGVCRRVLRDPHAADDAFQATFLVLARRAAAVVPRKDVGNWLYGVAYRTALKARTAQARRRRHERRVPPVAWADPTDDVAWRDLRPVLDAELARLPDRYRASVVLCDLEGKTRREAARQLGVPEGTVSSRLVRGRALLRQRLVRRGLAPAAVAPALAVGEAPAATLAIATVRAAAQVAAGQSAAGLVSARTAALTEGMVRAMVIGKMKTAAAALLAAGLLALGAGTGVYRTFAAEPGRAITEEAGPVPAPVSTSGAERLPAGPPPVPALVSFDQDGQLVVRKRVVVYVPHTTVLPSGQNVSSFRQVDRMQTAHYDRKEVKVQAAGGKALDAEAVAHRLQRETLAFVVEGGQPLDPLYLRLFKEGTLVFVLPPPPIPPAPSAPRVPAPAEPSAFVPPRERGVRLPPLPPGATQPDLFTVTTSSVVMPIRVEPSARSRLKDIDIFVSSDDGQTWEQVCALAPDADSFRFTAPRDGTYCFQLSVLHKDGRRDPPDLRSRAPAVKVRFQTGAEHSSAPAPDHARSGRDQEAEKDFEIAEYYRRTRHPGSAYFYYQQARRYPGTRFAERATERIAELAEKDQLPERPKSPTLRVGRVIIVGNAKTPDHVIRERVTLYPGQALGAAERRATERNLARLGIFRTPPTVTVLDPGQGGPLSGTGVNSDAGLSGSVTLNERSFDIAPAAAGPGSAGEFRDILIRVEEK